MNPARQTLFDPNQLRRAAGDKAFARGQGYADNGHIFLLSVSDDAILAAAFGADQYTVWLRRTEPEISGYCTCPAYEDAGFCKHMVATALVANEGARVGEFPSDRVGEIAARIAVLSKPRLEELLLEMATADWRALRSLRFSLGLDWDDDLN